MITVADYFAGYAGDVRITAEHRSRAAQLVQQVNDCLAYLVKTAQIDLDINPKTRTLISGTRNGGWRPADCPEGAAGSSHKEARGIDLYDSDGDIDGALNDPILERFGLYREHPAQTRNWCHLTNRSPRSGRRTFYA